MSRLSLERSTMATLIPVTLLVSLGLGLFFAISAGFARAERAECLSWALQGDAIPSWYSTDWQREQCHRAGVLLPDVKTYRAILRAEAPETLISPVRSQFDTDADYQNALNLFNRFGYWATEPSNYQK